ncbi:Fc.00g036440.m01.CDS01 [Cosmosporella sp. VM-42]
MGGELTPISTDKYPVLPLSDHWRLPHRSLPFIWSNINIPQASHSKLKREIVAQDRDKTCRISRHASALEVAHFVPVADEKWFLYVKSGSETQPTEDLTNLITLRRDIHYLFDTRRFPFVPKHDTASEEWSQALHVFSPDDNPDLIPLHHDRAPAPLSGISIEHVLARFVWIIFSDKTLRFFKGMTEYAVFLFDHQAGRMIENKFRSLEAPMSLKILGSSNCTPSPKKRTRDQPMEDDQFWAEVEEDEVSVASDWEPPRGRRRKRSWDHFNSDSPPELIPSFISTESDRSESQDGVAEKSEVELRPHDSPDAVVIRHCTASLVVM